MFENGKRSLPLHAHLKHSRLVIASHESTKATKPKALPAPPDAEACYQLLDQHLRHCHNTIIDLRRQNRRIQTRHKKLHGRQEALQLIRDCGPDCDLNEEKWLADKCTANNHALACSRTEKQFLLQHKINMLLAEIAATEEAMQKPKSNPLTP